jgi:hypothetical protein
VRVEKRVNRGQPQFVLLTDISSLPMLRFRFLFSTSRRSDRGSGLCV